MRKRLGKSVRFLSSAVSPDHDSARMTSLLAIMPRSPWLASLGCTNSAGVPVDAKVEAILRPTWPDLPMPVTIPRPCAARVRASAAAKLAPRPSRSAVASASMPPPSASSVRKAESIAACARVLLISAALSLAMRGSQSFIDGGFDSTERAARQAWRRPNVNAAAMQELTAFPQHLAHACQHGLDRDIGGAAVAHGVVALDVRALGRRFVAGRLEDGGDWIEWLPVPRAGRAEDRDCGRADRRGYMH